MTTGTLYVDNIYASAEHKRFFVRDVSFKLEAGTFACLLGASGCGKTSLLRCIAGLQKIQSGTIRIDDRVLNEGSKHVPAEQRDISMVFQDYALFPHFTVEKNIGFGIRSLPSGKRKKRVAEMLNLIGMESFAKRYPYELSGGQQQRVALARAIAVDPKLLLLDEPFSSLDASLRPEIAEEVKELVSKAGATTLMVTHDQNEALTMADMLGVMDKGELLQWDSAYNVYHRPVSRTIASFVGLGDFVKGRIITGNRIESALGTFPADTHFKVGEMVDVLIHPDDIIHDDDSAMQAVITKKQFRGSDFLYQLRLDNGELVHCFAPSHHNHSIGSEIGIVVDTMHVVAFSEESAGA